MNENLTIVIFCSLTTTQILFQNTLVANDFQLRFGLKMHILSC